MKLILGFGIWVLTFLVAVTFRTDPFSIELGSIVFFMHFPSIVLVLATAWAFSAAMVPGAKGATWFALLGAGEGTAADAERLRARWRAFGDMAVVVGLLAGLVGLVAMLHSLDRPDRIGPAMAVSIISILYATGLKIAAAVVEGRLTFKFDLTPDQPVNLGGLITVAIYPLMVMIVFFVLMFSFAGSPV